MSASDWVIVISAVSLGIVQIVSALKASAKVDIVTKKLDEQRVENAGAIKQIDQIHKDTNGNLSEMKSELKLARADIEILKKALLAKSEELAQSEAK